jgi:glycosyltransferase involved in cell wall biosynthesis
MRTNHPIAFTAVIPTHNRAATVGRAIQSALDQSYAPAEVVVVDDGSRDDTRAVVERFGPRVRCVHQENAGAAVARNRGVREASSEWIAFLDSDDYWTKSHLERMANAIAATDGAASFYFSDTRRAREGGPEDGKLHWALCGFSIDGSHELVDDASQWVLLRRQPMMVQSSVVRRTAYLEAGGMLPALRSRHDTHLFFKLCLGRPACAVAGCGAEMTADDQTGGRVTTTYAHATPAYREETRALYEDLLRDGTALRGPHRRELTERLAAAYLRLARLHWEGGRRGEAVAAALKALRWNPRRFAEGALRRLGLRSARPVR